MLQNTAPVTHTAWQRNCCIWDLFINIFLFMYLTYHAPGKGEFFHGYFKHPLSFTSGWNPSYTTDHREVLLKGGQKVSQWRDWKISSWRHHLWGKTGPQAPALTTYLIRAGGELRGWHRSAASGTCHSCEHTAWPRKFSVRRNKKIW